VEMLQAAKAASSHSDWLSQFWKVMVLPM
jgi:hypothetical protein